MTILFLLLTHAFAANQFQLKVESPEVNYSLKITKSQIEFESPTKKIKKPISKCGARAFENLQGRIESELKQEPVKLKSKSLQGMQITLNKDRFLIAPLTPSGVYLSNVETEIDYVLSEAIYRCSKK